MVDAEMSAADMVPMNFRVQNNSRRYIVPNPNLAYSRV